MLRTLNLDGDEQADLTVHGGPDKAVYAYPIEHYEFWRKVYPDIEMPNGMFGENFTTEGLLEAGVNIGDVFKIGSSEVIATQPRMPCYKLGVNLDEWMS
jgi:MOSC domain-containing protein YiiM